MLERERSLFDAAVVDLFGFNAVQLGLNSVDLLRQSRIPHRFYASAGSRGSLLCDFSQLPLATTSVDLLLLPHVLEFAEQPHQVLRDAERVLVPEGHLIVCGFNPVSLWGLRYKLCGRASYPWRGKFIPLMRIKDWLALLGLEVVAGRMACYEPPVTSSQWLQSMAWMEKAGDRWWPMMGGIYFLVARKRVAGMRLIRPQWGTRSITQVLMPRPRPTQKEFQKMADEN